VHRTANWIRMSDGSRDGYCKCFTAFMPLRPPPSSFVRAKDNSRALKERERKKEREREREGGFRSSGFLSAAASVKSDVTSVRYFAP
jgi:hypothetical protein